MDRAPQREIGLDILRGMAAFLVVCIHFPLEVRGGNYLDGLARVAVPLFFVFSGYFYQNTVKRNREAAQIKKMAKIFLGGNLLYFAWRAWMHILNGTAGEWLNGVFSPAAVKAFVFKNESPVGVHLWYLGAALYVLILVYFLRKCSLMKWACMLSIPLLAINICFGTWSTLLLGKTIPNNCTRNFLFVGLPFFCMGYAVFANQEKLAKMVQKYKKLLWPAMALLCVLNCAEQMFLFRNDLLVNKDLYITTPFLVFVLFVYFAFGCKKFFAGKMLAQIGKKYSLTIYLLQCMADEILFPIIRACGLQNIYLKMHAVVVFAACLGAAVLVEKLQKRYKHSGAAY